MSVLPLFDNQSDHTVVHNNFTPDAEIVLYPGNASDLISTIPNNAIQLVVTSPPYNLGKDYENRVSIERYLAQQADLINSLYRIVSLHGSVCWQVGNFVDDGEVFPLDILYYPIFKKIGFHLRNRIIWHFGHGLHTTKRFSGRYETLLWFTKTDDYLFNLDPVRVPAKYPGKRHFKGPNKGKLSGNPSGKNPSDVWEVLLNDWESGLWDIPNVKSNHPEKTTHPCQFPVELVQRCVLALSSEQDWVFDPFAGVGSTLIGAVAHQRRAMGSEKEPQYVDLARERIAAYQHGQLKLRPIGKPVHEPTGNEKVAQVPDEWRQSPQYKLFDAESQDQ